MNEQRFYVTSVEYNKQAQAENRTVPFAFNTIDEAKKKFYTVLGQNIGNASLSWCNVILWDNYGNLILREYWHEQEAVVTPEEQTAE